MAKSDAKSLMGSEEMVRVEMPSEFTAISLTHPEGEPGDTESLVPATVAVKMREDVQDEEEMDTTPSSSSSSSPSSTSWHFCLRNRMLLAALGSGILLLILGAVCSSSLSSSSTDLPILPEGNLVFKMIINHLRN